MGSGVYKYDLKNIFPHPTFKKIQHVKSKNSIWRLFRTQNDFVKYLSNEATNNVAAFNLIYKQTKYIDGKIKNYLINGIYWKHLIGTSHKIILLITSTSVWKPIFGQEKKTKMENISKGEKKLIDFGESKL